MRRMEFLRILYSTIELPIYKLSSLVNPGRQPANNRCLHYHTDS